jgi:hypothetical protein
MCGPEPDGRAKAQLQTVSARAQLAPAQLYGGRVATGQQPQQTNILRCAPSRHQTFFGRVQSFPQLAEPPASYVAAGGADRQLYLCRAAPAG